MHTVLRPTRSAVLCAGLFIAAFSAHAGLVVTVAAQGTKPDLLTNPAPPVLTPTVMTAINAFNANVDRIGGNEIESSPLSASFSYGPNAAGTASAVGALSIINGVGADFSLGRYNTTRDLEPIFGEVNPGHWLEAQSDVQWNFSGLAISAFSFFGTDFGDFGGSVQIEVFKLGTSMLRYDFVINPASPQNGDLRFFGVKGDTLDDTFDQIVLRINSPGLGDAIGIDSLQVGLVTTPGGDGNVPEPGSLMLAGLALAAAGGAMRRRRVI